MHRHHPDALDPDIILLTGTIDLDPLSHHLFRNLLDHLVLPEHHTDFLCADIRLNESSDVRDHSLDFFLQGTVFPHLRHRSMKNANSLIPLHTLVIHVLIADVILQAHGKIIDFLRPRHLLPHQSLSILINSLQSIFINIINDITRNFRESIICTKS